MLAQQLAGELDDLSIFRPAIDSRGYLTINASQVLGHKELSFGLGSLDYMPSNSRATVIAASTRTRMSSEPSNLT